MITSTKSGHTIQMPHYSHGGSSSNGSMNEADEIFATIAGMDNEGELLDEDLEEEEMFDGIAPLHHHQHHHHLPGTSAVPGAVGAKKGKKVTSTAEKKATHNAVERARRESLNTRFLVLADMLPGMNHVKRASKAAIVNKSIALIQDLQASEKKLNTENEALRAELAMLRQKLAGAGGGSPPVAAGADAAAAATAAATNALPHTPITPAGPMFPGMPAFAMPPPPHGMHPAMMPMMHHHQQQQQYPGQPLPPHDMLAQHPHMYAAAAAAAAAAATGMHPAYFGLQQSLPHGAGMPLVDPTHTHIKTEAGSPHSVHSQASAANTHNAFHTAPLGAEQLFPHGLFDFTAAATGGLATGSPAPSWANGPSPDAASVSSKPAAAGVAPSTSGTISSSSMPGLSVGQSSNGAASPAGSNASAASSASITTPANTFSPIPLPPQFAHTADASSSGTPPPPPPAAPHAAMAAFADHADPAALAAQFGPAELAKAQSELGAFIAYQQRMAGFAHAQAQVQAQAAQSQGHAPMQPTPSPTQTSFSQAQLPFPHPHANANAQPAGSPAQLAAQAAAMGSMPQAWQAMLAQHHQQQQLAHAQQQQQLAAAAQAMGAAGFAPGQF